MKKVLTFFGSKGYEHAKSRLHESAKDYFDEIIEYGEEDIDREFYISHIKTFQFQRGWGYWLWKPYFILKTMDLLEEGDFCFYLDCTAVFVSPPDILFDMCLKNQGVLLFDNAHYLNYTWTKADCFNMMGLTGAEYTRGRQVDAAIHLYQKNKTSISFINEWLSYCCNYNIISDAPNITGNNLPGFKEHRWDQSILSLLAIKHQIDLAKSPRRYGNYYSDTAIQQIIDLKRDVNREGEFYKNFRIN